MAVLAGSKKGCFIVPVMCHKTVMLQDGEMMRETRTPARKPPKAKRICYAKMGAQYSITGPVASLRKQCTAKILLFAFPGQQW